MNMIVEPMHQSCGGCLNKEDLVPNNKGASLTRPDGTIMQVQYIAPHQTYVNNARICSFRNILNFLLIISFLIFFVMVEFYGYGFQIRPGFSCGDSSISYKRQRETVSFWILMAGSLVFMPVSYLVLILFLDEKFTKRGAREMIVLYKEYWKGMLLLITINEAFKALVLEPRPDFFDVCNPDKAANCTLGNYVESFNCQNTEKYGARKMFDSTRSFPSGHAAMSVFATIFCWYLVQSRFPTKRVGAGLKNFFLIASVAFSLICSLTRITDRRHHWWDVLGGALLGAFFGIYNVNSIHEKSHKQNNVRGSNCAENYFDDENDLEKR